MRSMELILGMKPLGLFDDLATPWKTIYGPNSEPPPPGPNANPGQ